MVTRHRSQADGPGGWRNSNLRTRLEKIIGQAGLEPWPKLFHALRASFETELVERFPVQTVAAWLGNSPKVALTHYLRMLPEHFNKALQGSNGALQNPVQYGAELGGIVSQPESETALFPHNSTPCNTVQTNRRMGRDSNPRYTFA